MKHRAQTYSPLAAALAAGTLLLLGLGCRSTSSPAAQREGAELEPLEALVATMGERLAVMPKVAEWKRAHSRPVRDRARELVVLDNAANAVRDAAREAGVAAFSEASVRRFYQAQIDAAVDIQNEVLQGPAASGAEAPDLHGEIRPRLDRLGKRIAELLIVQSPLKDPQQLRRHAREHWQIEGLRPETREGLIVALQALLVEERD